MSVQTQTPAVVSPAFVEGVTPNTIASQSFPTYRLAGEWARLATQKADIEERMGVIRKRVEAEMDRTGETVLKERGRKFERITQHYMAFDRDAAMAKAPKFLLKYERWAAQFMRRTPKKPYIKTTA